MLGPSEERTSSKVTEMSEMLEMSVMTDVMDMSELTKMTGSCDDFIVLTIFLPLFSFLFIILLKRSIFVG